MTFGITFSINFPDRLNLVICNMYNAKTSFLQFQAFHFSIKNRSKNHVFLKPLLGPPFSHWLFDLFQKLSIWGPPSKSDGIQNGNKNRPSGAKNHKKLNCAEAPSRPWFSRNHSNYRAVGTSWLLKGHLFDVHWLLFCFCCVSLCSVLYNMFNTSFFFF